MAGIWARVEQIRRDKLFAIAHTQEGQHIFVSLKYATLLEDLELGDMLECEGLKVPTNAAHYPVAFSPRIIGYAPDLEPGPKHAPEVCREVGGR